MTSWDAQQLADVAKVPVERVTLALRNKVLPGKLGGHGQKSAILVADGEQWIRDNCPVEKKKMKRNG